MGTGTGGGGGSVCCDFALRMPGRFGTGGTALLTAAPGRWRWYRDMLLLTEASFGGLSGGMGGGGCFNCCSCWRRTERYRENLGAVEVETSAIFVSHSWETSWDVEEPFWVVLQRVDRARDDVCTVLDTGAAGGERPTQGHMTGSLSRPHHSPNPDLFSARDASNFASAPVS